MDEATKQALRKKPEEGAITAEPLIERWTQTRVKQLIKQEFGVAYHQNYISWLLDDLGWSNLFQLLEITPNTAPWTGDAA